jgi:hypothetical protein
MWPKETCSVSLPQTSVAWVAERWHPWARGSWAGVSSAKSMGAPPVQSMLIWSVMGCVPGGRGATRCVDLRWRSKYPQTTAKPQEQKRKMTTYQVHLA